MPRKGGNKIKMKEEKTSEEMDVDKCDKKGKTKNPETPKEVPAEETLKPSKDIDPGPTLIDAETLKDLLECPVCLRVPRETPIYQCARGHVVCGECKPKVTTCPQCREVLGNIRSLVSEKVLEKLPASCKYSDHGCQIEVMRYLLPAHESQCKYRIVSCVDLACQQRVSLSCMLNHLDSDHETEDFVRVEGGEYSSHFIINEEDFQKDIMWTSDQLHFDGNYFYRECCRSNKGLWYICISRCILGVTKDCGIYVYLGAF
ncbi:E3 ubiquitin-protein ligase DIS1 isoform X2 [Eurytemora carolleeae]|uniref:E3 ubiquitin-protein ligase DIS1 isoform X2 n=1 Tax=Eurytemora carolleeae TaxID=1294199 RepID=UPI000C790F95|nr:E3 ubiquitin-protein ligase DIS1 isoform X2 [Eurytemora carolleeae]|eukprot:XP_023340463.1 E3 ubiquitin-protein ligase DIS1-like isoform X2 [Eurytemora affinis]